MPDQETPAKRCLLRLYVAGSSARSSRAVRAVHDLCTQVLGDFCDLEVVDVYQRPDLAREDQVLAAPAVIRREPPPVRRFAGDVSDTARLLRNLGLPEVRGRG